MKKRPYKELLDPIGLIHQAGDQNDYQSCHPFDFRKTTERTGDLPEEEASPEVSPEEEVIPEEEEYHLEDHQEAVGDHHRYQCRKLHKPIKGN